MTQVIQQLSADPSELRFTPAGLSLPVPAQRLRSCSIRSPGYVSRTIASTALGTETDSSAHS